MARRLAAERPTSSIARLLDPAAAAEALVARPVRPPPDRSRQSRRALTKREVVLTAEADAAFQALIDACREGTQTRLTASHVVRALLRVVSGALPELRAALAKVGSQRLPSNGAAFEAERVRFEQVLADAILTGLRRAEPGSFPLNFDEGT